MAQIPNRIASIPFVLLTNVGSAFQRSTPVLDLDGAPIDLSAWFSVTIAAYDPNGQDPTTPLSTSTGGGIIVGNADGTIDLALPASWLAGFKPGAYTLAASGVPVSGDSTQLVATGQIKKEAY